MMTRPMTRKKLWPHILATGVTVGALILGLTGCSNDNPPPQNAAVVTPARTPAPKKHRPWSYFRHPRISRPGRAHQDPPEPRGHPAPRVRRERQADPAVPVVGENIQQIVD